jgi:hypothetical protein
MEPYIPHVLPIKDLDFSSFTEYCRREENFVIRFVSNRRYNILLVSRITRKMGHKATCV